jgi:predicted ATPase
VIGQEFSASLLAKVANKPIEDLLPELHSLNNSKIVMQAGATSGIYRFKHALLPDISYRSLLRKVRRQIHLSVAGELANPTTMAIDATDDLMRPERTYGDYQPRSGALSNLIWSLLRR